MRGATTLPRHRDGSACAAKPVEHDGILSQRRTEECRCDSLTGERGHAGAVPARIELPDRLDEAQRKTEARGELSAVPVNADRKRVLQVLTNLISNAAKFSPQDGTVEVCTTLSNGTVRVSVADRGSGIPESFRSRIFGRFAQADSAFTLQKGGTGLGLAICKRLIEAMGGRIGFEDRDGGGTVFYFELPLQQETIQSHN